MIALEQIFDKIVQQVPLTSAETAALLTSIDKSELRKMLLLRPLEAQGDKRTFLEIASAELLRRGKTLFVTCFAACG